jgi:hypothetical protein
MTPDEPEIGWTEILGEHATNPPHPRTTGETLFALGREWKVSAFENRLRAQFEQWLRRQAKLAIRYAEEDEDPEEAAKMRSAYIADLGAGHYTFDGRHSRSARGDLPGLRQMLFLALRRCHPDITEQQVERMFRENARDCGLALRWSLGNSEAPVSTPEGETASAPGQKLTKEQAEEILARMKRQLTLDSL